MCSTAFKKMCRRLDIPKWPHRQLRGIDKKISGLKAELATCTSSEEREVHLAELAALQDDKAKLLRGPGGADADSGSESSRSSTTGSVQSPACKPAPAARDSVPALAQEHTESDDGSANEVDSVAEGSVEQEPLPVVGPTGSIVVTQRELRNNFHLPLNTVAAKFCMCSTAFKKMCRRFGIAKWPHRKLRGIDRKIAAFKAEIKYARHGDTTYHRGLAKLEQEKALLCANVSTSKPLAPLTRPASAATRPSAPGLDVLASVVGMLPPSSAVDSPPAATRPVLELTVGRPMMSRCGNDAPCQKEAAQQQQQHPLGMQFDTPPLHPTLGPQPPFVAAGAMQV
mmetsp:Transcript_59113/g.145059  ORF Transcript_59113/g.145059 Transcript_59113/m.145059 type:complete len:340 (+) Transcript_59113:1-1020(+)